MPRATGHAAGIGKLVGPIWDFVNFTKLGVFNLEHLISGEFLLDDVGAFGGFFQSHGQLLVSCSSFQMVRSGYRNGYSYIIDYYSIYMYVVIVIHLR